MQDHAVATEGQLTPHGRRAPGRRPGGAGRQPLVGDQGGDVLELPGGGGRVDPAEEAHKIRRLVKFALAGNATPNSHQVLDDEIAFVEKNKKLKQNVFTNLLQDDNPDPSLPKVELVKYKDGSIRGLLFIQTDNVTGNNPNRLAWPMDTKREHKEEGR